MRQIHVIGGNTADIHVRLTPRTAKGGEVGKAVEEGVNAVKKIVR